MYNACGCFVHGITGTVWQQDFQHIRLMGLMDLTALLQCLSFQQCNKDKCKCILLLCEVKIFLLKQHRFVLNLNFEMFQT